MFENSPKITIIMTTYNAEKHIRNSIESVMKQSLKDIELLCVDGHSTDSTCKIIEEYCVKDSRVRLTYQERPTIGAAKNCGIEWARGRCFTFLDADDEYVDSDALKIMYEKYEETRCKIIGAYRSTLIENEGKVVQEILHHSDCEGNPDGVTLTYRERQYDYHFHSYIYDREMIINSDARFAEVAAYDDTHFFIRAMMCAQSFFVVPVELYRYRCGPPYEFKGIKAQHCMMMLYDQLRYAVNNKLEYLHWLTIQRINHEYSKIIVNSIKSGDNITHDYLVKANKLVSTSLIQSVLQNYPKRDYIEPMLHMNPCDLELLKDPTNNSKYILNPLYETMYGDNPVKANNVKKITSIIHRIKKWNRRDYN